MTWDGRRIMLTERCAILSLLFAQDGDVRPEGLAGAAFDDAFAEACGRFDGEPDELFDRVVTGRRTLSDRSEAVLEQMLGLGHGLDLDAMRSEVV